MSMRKKRGSHDLLRIANDLYENMLNCYEHGKRNFREWKTDYDYDDYTIATNCYEMIQYAWTMTRISMKKWPGSPMSLVML